MSDKEISKKDATANESKKGSNVVVIVIVVVLAICLIAGALTMWACKKITLPWQKAASGGTYQIGDTTVNVNKNQLWPSDIPSNIPKFTAGTIEASGKVSDVWTITASGIADNDFTAYKDALKKSGWTVNSESEINMGNLKSFAANANDGSGYVVNVIMSTDEKNAKSILISVSKELTQ